MNSAGLEPEAEAEAVADILTSANKLHRSSTASESAASSSAGMVLRPAEQEGRDVKPPLMSSQGVPRPKTNALGHIRANLDTLFALVSEPSRQDSVVPPSRRTSSASTKKRSLQTLEMSAPEREQEEGQDAAALAQTLRKAKVPQRESRVSRNKAEPLRNGCQQECALSKSHGSQTKKVREFVSKLERQREFQQSSLEKCTGSTRATIAEPHTGSKHGTSKVAGCTATATRASCSSKEHL